MFISIINNQCRAARDRLKPGETKDAQMLTFMVEKVRRWIGKSGESAMFTERDEAMREKYYNPVEHFPDKIDQLLNALDRIYVSQQSVQARADAREQ